MINVSFKYVDSIKQRLKEANILLSMPFHFPKTLESFFDGHLQRE